MTSKVVEANSGVFAAGLAVAPVTDWRFYGNVFGNVHLKQHCFNRINLDSIYTERYMLTPELNPGGYAQSAVSNMTGFENTRYLLVHGTGDDNGKLVM